MSIAELFGIGGAALSGLLALVIALIGVIYRNDEKSRESSRTEQLARLNALEKQNVEQETKIATLSANASNHDLAMDRLTRAIEKLDDKIDMLVDRLVGRKQTPPPFQGQR